MGKLKTEMEPVDTNGKSDHEILLLIVQEQSWIKTILGNHLNQHSKITIALAIGVVLMLAERVLGFIQ